MLRSLEHQRPVTALICFFLGVPVVAWSQPALTQERSTDRQVTDTAKQLFKSGQTVTPETIRKQLERESCHITRPPVSTRKLTTSEIQLRAQKAHLRVGWVYLCTKCNQWHNNLAGGYALTTNGAIATCYHVVNPPRDFRTGALIAVSAGGSVIPVVEVLAANRYADACIVQAKGGGFTPLPLNTNLSVGAVVYCLNNPQAATNGFSQGTVNRFLQLPERRLENVHGAPLFAPLRIQVSATWELGASGSALFDECGNTIGHASTVTRENNMTDDAQAIPPSQNSYEATSARDVLSLVQATP